MYKIVTPVVFPPCLTLPFIDIDSLSEFLRWGIIIIHWYFYLVVKITKFWPLFISVFLVYLSRNFVYNNKSNTGEPRVQKYAYILNSENPLNMSSTELNTIWHSLIKKEQMLSLNLQNSAKWASYVIEYKSCLNL